MIQWLQSSKKWNDIKNDLFVTFLNFLQKFLLVLNQKWVVNPVWQFFWMDAFYHLSTFPKMNLVECTELILQSEQPATLILNQSNWWQGAKDIFSTQLTFHSMTTHTSPLDIDFYNTLLSSPWEKNHCYVHTCLPTCYWCK